MKKIQSVLNHPVKQFPWRKKWWKNCWDHYFQNKIFMKSILKNCGLRTVLQQCFRGKCAIKKIKKMRLHICISFYDGQTVQKIFLLDMHEKCSHLFVIKGWVSLKGRFLIEKKVFFIVIRGMDANFWNFYISLWP